MYVLGIDDFIIVYIYISTLYNIMYVLGFDKKIMP